MTTRVPVVMDGLRRRPLRPGETLPLAALPAGVSGGFGFGYVPTLIPDDAEFVVPAGYQAPYRFGCRVEGLCRIEGHLVMTP